MNNYTSILNTYICGKHYPFDFNALWTFCLALITILLVCVTIMLWLVSKRQLGGINETNKADFAFRCMTNFFTLPARQLFMLIDYDLLLFKKDTLQDIGDFAYFEIDQTKLKSNPILSSFIENPEKKYSAHDMDDILLGPLNDIGTFNKKGLMDMEIAEDFFRYYIVRICENPQIKAYRKWHKTQPEGENTYSGLDAIYKKLRNKDKPEDSEDKPFRAV